MSDTDKETIAELKRLLEEERRERRKQDEEQRKKDEERRKQDEERRKQDEKRRKQDEEQRKKDEEQRKKDEERRKQDEERRKQDEERRKQDEERRKQDEDQRHTTLPEYLLDCHSNLYMKFTLATPASCTQGIATSVAGKFYPKFLRSWGPFSRGLQERFNELRAACGDKQLFSSAAVIRQIAAPRRKIIGNETATGRFESVAVEDRTWELLTQVGDQMGLREEHSLMDLQFTDDIRGMTGQMEDSDIGHGEPDWAKEPTVPDQPITPPRMIPDGYGVIFDSDGNRSIAFVYEYKPAHKFAVEYLEGALQKETLFRDANEWDLSHSTLTKDEAKTREASEAGIAMALTQVFNYMIWNGVSYGYIAAGMSYVFLYHNKADPQTLYYHLSMPRKLVTSEDWATQMSNTAVAQLASFCLQSLRSKALNGPSLDASIREVRAKLVKWGQRYDQDDQDEEEVSSSSSDETTSSAASRVDPSYKIDISPAKEKYKSRPRSCKVERDLPVRRKKDEDDETERHQERGGTQSRAVGRKRGSSSKTSNKASTSTASKSNRTKAAVQVYNKPTKQYCTQACLLGLKNGRDLSDNCPNVLLHRAIKGNDQHPIDITEFTRLMDERLRKDPYDYCEALSRQGLYGRIGVLFKLELAPYGYTFVGKGTTQMHLNSLKHETTVYERLHRLQGEVVPVHLGLVELPSGYIFPGGARAVHMMLMSFCGQRLRRESPLDLELEVSRCLHAIEAEGVRHFDVRDPNLLWNAELGRVMVIDFDQTRFLKPPKHKAVSDLSREKKKRRSRHIAKYHGEPKVVNNCPQAV